VGIESSHHSLRRLRCLATLELFVADMFEFGGPPQHQADALMKLREAMANLEAVSVDLGLIAVR
jgi:hypothetical protein